MKSESVTYHRTETGRVHQPRRPAVFPEAEGQADIIDVRNEAPVAAQPPGVARDERSVDFNVALAMLSYPGLYAHRGDVLNTMFCVFASGYQWQDGALVKDYQDDARTAARDQLRHGAPYPASHGTSRQQFFPMEEDAPLLTVPDNVRADWLGAARETIDLILASPDQPPPNELDELLASLTAEQIESLRSAMQTIATESRPLPDPAMDIAHNKRLAQAARADLDRRFPAQPPA